MTDSDPEQNEQQARDQDAGAGSRPSGAAADDTEREDQDAGPASEPTPPPD